MVRSSTYSTVPFRSRSKTTKYPRGAHGGCKLHWRKTASISNSHRNHTAALLTSGPFRNVARTRFRDSTRRVQKNHFGRRRLGILSRGLVNGTHTNRTEEPTCGISGILLEHAQREIPRPPISNAACETGALDALSFDRSPATGPSRTGSSVTPSSSKVTHALGSGNCESPQPLSSD